MIKRDKYEAALKKLNYDKLRQAIILANTKLKGLPQFDNRQSKIDNWINEYSKKRKDVRSKSTYVKYLINKLYDDNIDTIESDRGARNAIEYLLLFYDELSVRLQCVVGEDGYDVKFNEQGEADVLDADSEEKAVYDVFYWRTTRDDVGVAKLSLSDDWEKVDLVYHYLSAREGMERAFMTGRTFWNGPNNLYAVLHDTGVAPANAVRVFLSLYVPDLIHKRIYIAGVFASSNRDSHEPVCGMVLLRQNETNTDISRSDYVSSARPGEDEKRLQNIPDNIYYAVSNTRIKVGAQSILDARQIPYTPETLQLAQFVGTYQAYQPQPSDCLRLMKLVIQPNGRVVLTRKNGQVEGFVDHCQNILLIKFDYQPQTTSYLFYVVLERNNAGDDLTGIYAGIGDDTIVSTRLYLRRVVNEPVRTAEIQHVDPIKLKQLTAEWPEVAEFLNDTRLTTTDAFWTSHLGYMFGRKDEQPVAALPRSELTGSYNAFFLTKIEIRPRRDNIDHTDKLPEQRIQLIRMPVYINHTDVTVVYGGRSISGTLLFDGVDQLTVQFNEPTFWGSMVLSVPMPGEYRRFRAEYHYGILTRLFKREPETSALILHRETDADYLTYRAYEHITDLLDVDRRYAGLMSFLFGDWARFVRMPGYEKTNGPFTPKYATFRRTFFAAACHHGARNEVDRCLENLTRAFRHGFGLYQFGSVTAQSDTFPAELKEERIMLREALVHSLHDERVKRYVRRYWKLSTFP